MTLEFHPIANLFPLIEGKAFDDLVADVKANGLHDKIIMLDGKILDGRNRYRASIAAGLFEESMVDWEFNFHLFKPFEADFHGQDPLAWVLSKNLHRRHLTESQRAMVAHNIEGLTHGGARRGEDENQDANLHLDRATASEMMHVSPRSVANASKVGNSEAPELGKAVMDGKLSVSAAADLTALPAEEQRRIINAVDPKVLRSVVKEARARLTAEKKQARADREQRAGKRILSLPGRQFGVICADPEWQFKTHSEETGMDKAADNIYPTSALVDIMRRDVAAIAAPDCVLFLWATVPMLVEALCVLDAWGFACIERDPDTGFLMPLKAKCQYVSHLAWLKQTASGELANGTGFWLINEHEILLIAKRGNVVAPAMGTQAHSVLKAPRGAHSEKPEMALEIIETYFPTVPKIELNRRGKPRPGWCAWGNEVEGDEALGISVDENGFADAMHLALPTAKGSATEDRDCEIKHQYIPSTNTGNNRDGKNSNRVDSGSRRRPDGDSFTAPQKSQDLKGDSQAGGIGEAGGEGNYKLAAASGAFEQALLEHAGQRGSFTKAAAEPLLKLGREVGRTPKQLAEDLGHPLGTIKTWLHHLNLTDIDHMHAMNAARAAKAKRVGEGA